MPPVGPPVRPPVRPPARHHTSLQILLLMERPIRTPSSPRGGACPRRAQGVPKACRSHPWQGTTVSWAGRALQGLSTSPCSLPNSQRQQV